jgi:sugar/nucleoside kinase (ribokinase family)
MIEIIALGELLIDFTCADTDTDGYPLLAAHPGGAPANYLAAANAFGVKTALLAKVGDDMFGKMLLGTLQKAGIDTRGVVVDADVFTTLAFVTLDEQGDRSFSFARKPGADTQLRFEEIDLSLLDEAKVFHFGSLSLTQQPARSTTQKAVAYAQKKGKLITFDPNLREPLWEDLAEAKAQILWGFTQADVVKLSEEEAQFLWQCGPEQAAQILMADYHCRLVFVTLGPKGCYFANRNGGGYVAAPPVPTEDTTGAGDIFGGSAVGYLLELQKEPQTLTLKEMAAITAFACTAASLSTLQHGGITSVVPKAQVETALQNRV